MLVNKSLQEASNISKDVLVELNVKINLTFGPGVWIWNSLYQIQTMQPKDSSFLIGTESSLY